MQQYGARSIWVYLLDDHDIVRRGLKDLLAVKDDITVVGDSGSAQGALPRIIDLAPDVLVVDLHLQDGTGVRMCRDVRARAPRVQALILTSADADEALVSTVLAGAAGYATKLVSSLEILDGIRRIGAGRPVLNGAERQRVHDHLVRQGAAGGLGESDREVLSLILDGHTDTEIAETLSSPAEVVRLAVDRIVDELTRHHPA
jgi:two-component system response regulator DevR